jgi:hypothetical protein
MSQSNARRRLEDSIRRVSRAMVVILWGAVAAYPLGLCAFAFGGRQLILNHPWIASRGLVAADLGPGLSAVFFVALALAAAPLAWGLWRLRRMFVAFADGRIFDAPAIAEFERFAWALGATAFAGPLAGVVFGPLLRLADDRITPSISLSLSSTDAATLLLSLVLGVVAKVMRMAAELAEENAGYV